ncbi:unnamed protein product [Thelazia callipaeda]|uniref:Transposase n=1 Tax=Thelazia callipaeda TaxID=103827 RepID=A0A0N5D284_THECL|nr:unnamed protein product [Thelazia callipaeda]
MFSGDGEFEASHTYKSSSKCGKRIVRQAAKYNKDEIMIRNREASRSIVMLFAVGWLVGKPNSSIDFYD